MLLSQNREVVMTVEQRIQNLVGADCVLGNEMKGHIVGVSLGTRFEDVDASINVRRFSIRLESGHVVRVPGSVIASISKVY